MLKMSFFNSSVWNTFQKRLFFFICVIAGIAGCVDFSIYSDSNEVMGVKAGILSADDVSVDKLDILSSAEGRIVLQLKGKLEENIPLTVDAEFELSPESKILYGEKYKQFVFHSLQDSFSFQVIAQSGLPKKWTLSVQDARSREGDILSFGVKSWEAGTDQKDLIAGNGRLYRLQDTSLVELFLNTVSDTIFPLKIVPGITVSESGRLLAYEPGQALTFADLGSVCHLKVEAENKEVKNWRVFLRTPDSDDANVKEGSFTVFSDCLEVTENVFHIDTTSADALVNVAQVKDWKNFNVQLNYNLKLPLGAKMVLLEEETPDFTPGKVVFEKIEEVKRFKVVSQSGKEKIWKIKLGYTYTDRAEVENFSITSWRPESSVDISVDASAVDTSARVIRVWVNSGVKTISEHTPLHILPVVKLSDKAIIDGLEPEPGGIWHLPEVSFHHINDIYRFTILSEARKEYEWSIVLVDKQKEKNAEAEVQNVLIHADKLPEQVVFSDDIFTADAEKQEIVLKLNAVRFPFLLEASAYTVNISDKAKLLDEGQILVFEDVNDHKSVRVEAENGTEKVWTLRLNYTRNRGADIRSLHVDKLFPEDVSFDKVALVDAENAEVTILVTDAGKNFPLRADVSVEVSGQAYVQPELKSVVFADENAYTRVHVISEAGIDREWSIKLKNRSVKSDKAEVVTFTAESLQPEIQIGSPVTHGNIISVPVLSGKNKFPLSLDIDASVISEGAKKDKVVLSFENISRTEVFTVTSQDGKVSNRYTVKLEDQVPLSAEAEITDFKLERYQPLSYQVPNDVKREDGKVWIKIYDDIVPALVVKPVLTLSEGAKLEQARPVLGMDFTSNDSEHEIVVVAENGTKKAWKVGLLRVERPKNSEAVIEEAMAKTENNITVQPVIKENREVILYTGNSQLTYPCTIETTLSVSPNAKVEVISQPAMVTQRTWMNTRAGGEMKVVQVVRLTFHSADDKVEVKVISEDQSTDNIYHFILGGEKCRNIEANILEYKITSYFPMNMEEEPMIFAPDTTNAVITVNAPGEDVFPFTIYTKVRLSAGAALNGLDANTMTFERGFTEKEFEVVSEAGQVKKWKLVMKVAEKSRENAVTAFDIKSYLPSGAGVGKAEIHAAERKIVIPVANWVKGERLSLEAQVEVSPKATTDFRENLFFQTARDEYSFNVTAQNGDLATWTVVLDYTFSDQADLTSFRVTGTESPQVVYKPQGVIDVSSSTVYIDVLENLSFPFVVTVDMAFSDKAEVDLSGLSGNKIRFDRYQDSTVIRVTAENEITRKDWKVKLRYHFSEEADITDFRILASQPAGVVLGTPAAEISAAEHTIWINVNDWGGMTNLQITPALTVSDKATHSLNGNLLFVKKNSESKVIPVTAESGKVVPWTVKLRYEESSEAEITKITYGGWEPSGINFIGTTIDSGQATVTLELQTWNGQTTFTLKDMVCVLSDKATASIPAELTFRKRIQESVDYIVKAQDGTEKKWTFRLLYHESNAAEVTRFRITGSNKEGIISMAATGMIGDGVISIDLNSGVRDAFESGFQIQVETELSAKATSDFPSSMLFSRPTDTRRYTVTAESGLTKEWTVKFVNNASQDASILALRNATVTGGSTTVLGDFKCTDFRVSGTSVGMTITDVITKNKYDRNWPILAVDLDLQLSARAKVKEGNTLQVAVSNPGTKTLTVLADDGIHQQTYQLEVAYKPQLENANLDSWSDNKTPGGSIWSSANNTFVSGTAKTTGKSGSGAVMTTSEAVGMKAAGTIFLGSFKFTSLTDALNDPEKMTYFGIAFPARPKQLKVDLQYKQGNGTLNDGSRDKGQVWVALEYWPDPDNAKNPNNKRYAYGEVMLDQNIGSWTTYTITLNITDASVVPTHLLIVATSSYDGNHFNAVNGSELKVDNFELVY